MPPSECYVIPTCPRCSQELPVPPTVDAVAHLGICATRARKAADACDRMALRAAEVVPGLEGFVAEQKAKAAAKARLGA